MSEWTDFKTSFIVHDISLGSVTINGTDYHRYIHPTKVTTKWSQKEGSLVIRIIEHELKDYKVPYCVVCLQNGTKNSHFFSSDFKDETYCKDHYEEKMRRERPERACHKCDKGYMREQTVDMACSNCDYREPHVHNVRRRFDGLFSLVPERSPIKTDQSATYEGPFMCTCMEWDTPDEHQKRREMLKGV